MTNFFRILQFACFALAFSTVVARADDGPPKFRTDAQGPYSAEELKKLKGKTPQEVPQWFQLVDGQFPPAGSEHAISGELVWVDHLERRFHLRVDRNDSQDRGVWDLPVDAVMLPYGSIEYLGAPAALQDIPLGTHLHGLFYLRAPDDATPPPDANNNRKTPEIDFRRCLRLVDDFSYRAQRNELWQIESVDLTTRKLNVVLQQNGKPIGKPQAFDLQTYAIVYEGRGFGTLESLKPGQNVTFNYTWGTLYGPGRVTHLWIDDASRRLATEQQLARHRNHVRERGLAGWVTAVDDEKQIVTITFFDGLDAKLFDDLTAVPPDPIGATPATAAPSAAGPPPSPKGSVAVARESLMTYDPVNDRKGGNVLEIKKIPVEPGSSGVQIRVQVDMMLEGYRPRRVVRYYPAVWKVTALPREEQFFGRE